MIIHRIEQRSEAWYLLHTGRVTGTSFKTLMMGESTAGYQELINRLAIEIILGVPDVNDTGYKSKLMLDALETENEAAEEFERLYGVVLEQVGFITPGPASKFKEWIGVSPDSIYRKDYGLEIKCPLAKTHLGYIENGGLPKDYLHQVQGSMFTTNLKQWVFMSYYPDMKPFVLMVERDEELHQEYDKRLTKLIDNVNAKLDKYNKYDYLI